MTDLRKAAEQAQPEQAPSSVQQAYAMAQVCLDLHDALGCKWGDNVYLAIDQLKAAAHTPQRKPEQEPYGYVSDDKNLYFQKEKPEIGRWIKVFTAPPQRKPEQDVPEASCGNMEPVGWFESPDGEFRANPLYKIKFPSKLLSWQVPLYMALPEQEPVALVIDGVLVKSELPEKYTGHLYTAPPQPTEQEPFEDLATELFVIAQISPADDGFSDTIERIESWLREHFSAPPQRTGVDLTDEELDLLDKDIDARVPLKQGKRLFARAVLAKAKEKNT
jgi:hypothetical protein